jgi:hypothetical protein
MREAHAHAYGHDTPLALPDELLPNDLTIEGLAEDADALSRRVPHDDLDAARGILLSCVIGAYLWLVVAMVVAWVF